MIETEPDAWERFEKAVHKIAPPKKAKAKPKEEKPKQGDPGAKAIQA